ncbi:MAG TPA: nickel-dependent hydrogenase large subunit [Acidimicrobiales bacterium]|nr:nickel-dependent hydrogenase large subunit [Acidimicrobiales bacterium]
MAQHIVVDPVTRIEGHLRVEVVLDADNTVTKAWSSSTMFRGIETILQGRDPRDAGMFTQRMCGVCTLVHYLASHRAVENAFEITVPKNARLVRNLKLGAQFIHDHPVHFYALSALDYVDLLSALKASPAKAVQVAYEYSDNPYNVSAGHYRDVQSRLTAFAQQDPSLGVFGNAYWGNPSYKLTPEQNLVAVSHYLDCLDVQRVPAKMMALFGGKNPHPQADVVGGVTCVEDLADPSRLARFGQWLQETNDFIARAYIPDVLMVGKAYAGEAVAGIGAGLRSYMSYGGFELDDTPVTSAATLFPSGVVLNGDLSRVVAFNQAKVTEDVTHSWYAGDVVHQPYEGVTVPDYTGLNPRVNGVATLKSDEKYSWVKAPTHDDHRVEVGPLARLLVGYASGNTTIRHGVDGLLKAGGFPLSVLFSSIGRHAARAVETQIIADAMGGWLNELEVNTQSGDLSTWTDFDFAKVSGDTEGYGLLMAPRGSLGHWVRVKEGAIVNYQTIAPTTWNASPRDGTGRPGAYESALVGVRLADPSQPLEVLRTLHSFDPCLACAVHLVDARGRDLGSFEVVSSALG